MPTEKHNDRITLCRDEAEHKDVLATAVIALGNGLAQRTLCVQDNLLMLGSDEMVDNMRGRSIAARVAEPLRADETFHDRGGGVYATVTVRMVLALVLYRRAAKSGVMYLQACGGRSTCPSSFRSSRKSSSGPCLDEPCA